MAKLPLKLSVEEQSRLGILNSFGFPRRCEHEEVGAGAENVQMGFQLGKALVSGLAEAKDALDDVEDVLDLAADAGLLVLQLPEPVGARAFVPGILAIGLLPVGTIVHLRQMRVGLHVLVFTDGAVGRIAVQDFIVLADQVCRHRAVRDIGRCDDRRVDIAASRVYAHMQLRTEEPLVALPGLVHLGVALALRVLRGRRRVDDRRVHDGAAVHHPAMLFEEFPARRKVPLAQSVVVDELAELAQRRRVWHALRREVQSHELPHGIAVVDRVLNRLVRQVEPRRQQVHPEHYLNATRRTATVILVVVRLDHRHDLIPRRDRVHRLKKFVPLRLPLPHRVLQVRETLLLLHRYHSLSLLIIPHLLELISSYLGNREQE